MVKKMSLEFFVKSPEGALCFFQNEVLYSIRLKFLKSCETRTTKSVGVTCPLPQEVKAFGLKDTVAKKHLLLSSRWWQLKYFLFSPLPGEMIQFDEHIFQMG